jgi:hypothetical protein
MNNQIELLQVGKLSLPMQIPPFEGPSEALKILDLPEKPSFSGN